MTNGDSREAQPAKNRRRQEAREKARVHRERQARRDRRGRVALQGGLALVLVAIVTTVGLIIWNGVQPPGPGPANMASDGIHIGEGFVATPTAALASDADPVPTQSDENGTVDIRVYVDYLCPYCKLFEETNAEQLEGYLETGAATVEIHPLAVLTSRSQGTQYSLRAANAAACVANYAPDNFWSFNSLLFENQPAEQTSGLPDTELLDIAEEAGVPVTGDMTDCVTDQRYKGWVNAATDRVLAADIPNSNIDEVDGTPIVIVNGKQYRGALDDASEFAAFVLAQSADGATSAGTSADADQDAEGDAESDEDDADESTPAPSESPTPAP
ncbi:DsbA family protein [Planctomonas psychrotolerans]|uniref:DsbA family protein n=1 Tax=Planctomonas psychrotolerans TaxID=2528712 RepID=UPI00123AB6C0|nr:thioredoxin domain-containing protein [Planctomonas psychrotolerans]